MSEVATVSSISVAMPDVDITSVDTPKGRNGKNGTKVLDKPTTYTQEDALEATTDYFGGDDLAASSVVTKYLLKDTDRNLLERTPAQMHDRIAREFARMEAKFGGDRALTYDEIMSSIGHFAEIIPAGSPMYGVGNEHAVVSLSNCVIVSSPEDDISSIVNQGKDLANLFKRRCGVGIDISTLRPEGSLVSNSAGTTTGAWSFADFYSYVCRMIGQNGRRGALMISMDVRHPDIENFITMKQNLAKVTGANVSVKIRDDFMEAVEADGDYELRWPVDSDPISNLSAPSVRRTIKAKELWDKIVESATKTAEPGLLMWDNILNELPAQCYADDGFETVTTNPCGEIPLSPYDSCRLIALNLTAFVCNPYTPDAYFDFEAFGVAVSKAMRMSDDLVELESEKLRRILDKVDTEDETVLWTKMLNACLTGRRTGLGTLGLGDTFVGLGLTYASPESIEMADRIYGTLKECAYAESVRLAQERGPFAVWSWEKERDNPYIQRLPEHVLTDMRQHGRRNISLLTNAPTGTSSICAQTSSGIEPIFKIKYTRKFKLVGMDIQRVDYVDEMGDKWQEFDVLHHSVKQYMDLHGDCEVEELPDYFVDAEQIDWVGRVDMQATIQQHIDHSISSTINLPADTDPEVVDTLYRRAWKRGLKGVTVYVDGSRDGVLVSRKKPKVQDGTRIVYMDAPKRPLELHCEIHRATVKGEGWIILVGLLRGKPYEVFGGKAEYVDIPDKYKTGTLIKNPRKTVNARYDLKFGEEGAETTLKNVIKWFENQHHAMLTRFVSMSLRHGVPTQYVVEQLQKNMNDDLWSFSKVLARVLKKHIPDGTVRDKICPECKTSGLVYQEGCLACKNCGHSKCG